MSVPYFQTSSAGVAVRVTGPALFAPGGHPAGAIAAALHGAAQEAGTTALGAARAAYSPAPIVAGWGLVVRVSARATLIALTQASPLFPVVEYPTRPHLIRGRGGPLHWISGGSHRFAWQVQHPGTPGKHRLPGLQAGLARAFEAAVVPRLLAVLGGA